MGRSLRVVKPVLTGGLTLAALLGTAALLSGCGSVSSPAALNQKDKAELQEPTTPSKIAEQKPPSPKHYDVAPAPKPKAEAPGLESEPPDIPVSEMPPASAGTNGSYDPPDSSEQKAITPRTMARLEEKSGGLNSILLSGIALAPPGAPERVKAAISGANEIVGRPYIWGGGHASWYSRGYDCSGAVSYALAAGGFLQAPLASGALEAWGAPGPGRWITVYANAGHAYAVIAGLRWDTVGDASGTGPRWHPALAYPEGFVERHPVGF
jgi:cell wall-associated NlpC family hydrolase